jgi:hypothetical protein
MAKQAILCAEKHRQSHQKEVHHVDAPLIDPVVLSAAALSVSLLALIVMTVLSLRQRQLLKRYRTLLSGNTEQNMERLILSHSESIELLQSGQEALIERFAAAETAARLHVQRSATVRFNAFPDTGSDQSFAIALLDANGDGVVLSSLYGRNESRVYAKPIKGEKSTYQLTGEEKDAIAKASGHK